MDYTEFTPEQQHQAVKARIRQYEQSHFLAVLDMAAARASGEDEQAAALLSQAEKWEAAAAAAREILAGMPPSDRSQG